MKKRAGIGMGQDADLALQEQCRAVYQPARPGGTRGGQPRIQRARAV